MERALNRVALAAMAGSCAALVMGCEALISDGVPPIQVDTAADHAGPPVSRARVLAELREAQRLGMIPEGEQDIPQYTAEQNRLVARAGDAADAQERAVAEAKPR